jgi:hypothetical protein
MNSNSQSQQTQSKKRTREDGELEESNEGERIPKIETVNKLAALENVNYLFIIN